MEFHKYRKCAKYKRNGDYIMRQNLSHWWNDHWISQPDIPAYMISRRRKPVYIFEWNACMNYQLINCAHRRQKPASKGLMKCMHPWSADWMCTCHNKLKVRTKTNDNRLSTVRTYTWPLTSNNNALIIFVRPNIQIWGHPNHSART